MNRILGASVIATVVCSMCCFGVLPASATVPSCFGKTPNVVGTAGDDTIHLRNGVVDVVYTGGGNDVVEADSVFESPLSDVADFICTGTGVDSVYAGTGNDHINGGDGDDRLS